MVWDGSTGPRSAAHAGFQEGGEEIDTCGQLRANGCGPRVVLGGGAGQRSKVRGQ